MHSSGMHTACLLTVSQHALCQGGVPAWGVPAREEGYLPRGVSAQGIVPAQGVVPAHGGVPVQGGVPE